MNTLQALQTRVSFTHITGKFTVRAKNPALLCSLLFWLAPGHVFTASCSEVVFGVSSQIANPGETVKAQVSIPACSNLTSVQFTLQWNGTVLQYLTNGDFGLNSLGVGNFNTALTPSGKLLFSWDDPSATGVTQPGQIVLFTMTFLVTGGPGASSPITFVDSPTLREVGVNAQVATFVSQNGQVSIRGTPILELGGNLAFGDVAVGSSVMRILSLSNSGNSTLTISNILYPALFNGNWSAGAIGPGKGTNLNVTFTPTNTNTYAGQVVIISDTTGGTTSLPVSGRGVIVIDSNDLAAALNTPGRVWRKGGAAPFIAQTLKAHDGVCAAQSGVIKDGYDSWVETTINGPGTLSFWWKVSCETNNDRLRLYLNGSEQLRISGEIDWEWRSLNLPAGSQVLRWRYSKSSSTVKGLDRAWLDEVRFGPTPPAITSQPLSQTVDAGTTVCLKVTASGTPPLNYQWWGNGVPLSDGGNIRGAQTATLTFSNAQLAQAGPYWVVVSNPAGTISSSNASLAVLPVFSLAEAMDMPGWIWRTGGSLPWQGQNGVTHDGEDAARSGPIKDSYDSWLETTVSGPGTLSFWWKVSSETNNDQLRFYVNGTEKTRISGEVDWQRRVYDLPAGSQILRWRYYKSSSTRKGQDRAWLDQLQFTPMPPAITKQPCSQSVESGTTICLTVAAAGTPPLVFQWWANGKALTNGNGVNGTQTSSLSISNIQVPQAGTYWVVVTNLAGTSISSNASLTVLPVFTLPEAVDTPTWVWRTGGSAVWKGFNNLTHDGVDAARSGTITSDQESWMEATVTGPGTVGFWWKVSSETNYDRLRLYVNGSEKLRISGEVDWQWQNLNLSSGNQILRWRYSKNSSRSKGQDRGWVDQVQFVPTTMPAPSQSLLVEDLLNLKITLSLNKVTLSWNTKPEKTYQVFYKESLADPEWHEHSAEAIITGTSAVLVENIESHPMRYYQVWER